MAAAFLQLPLSSSTSFRHSQYNQNQYHHPLFSATSSSSSKLCIWCSRRSTQNSVALVGKGDTELRVSQENESQDQEDEDEDEEEEKEATPEELEYIAQIKRVLELLRKNRDMLFSEVKLTIMIEDPREVERKRLLGIDDSDTPTRDDLAEALEQINEGKIPKNRVAVRMLAEEMSQWPNLEVEATKKKPSKSLYAKVTDTGIDLELAAKRLNVDWDSAAEIEDSETSNDTDVPSAVGYGALYLITAFPVIIGISVVLILFYNSLQ